MTKKYIFALLLTGATVASQPAFSADGTISFSGKVTAQTCKINGNGSASNSFTVTLPTVSTSTLATAGQTAGRTPFSIELTECEPKSGNVHAYFEAGNTVDTTTGNLILASGGATNVEIGLLNGIDETPIHLGVTDAAQNSKPIKISSTGTATLPFYAQYVAMGSATAGTANTQVLYSLAYQ